MYIYIYIYTWTSAAIPTLSVCQSIGSIYLPVYLTNSYTWLPSYLSTYCNMYMYWTSLITYMVRSILTQSCDHIVEMCVCLVLPLA